MYSYKPTGVCAKAINFDVFDNKICNVSFVNGCSGNLQGMSRLLEGIEVEEAISKLKGIKCQGDTSCPDQFAKALEELVINKSSK